MDDRASAVIQRTDRFAVDVAALIRTFSTDEPGPTAQRQLARSATSVAANHRAARRSRSHKEFTARIGVVAEEAVESLYWLNFAAATRLTGADDLGRLAGEANELTAIFSAMAGTARHNQRSRVRGQ